MISTRIPHRRTSAAAIFARLWEIDNGKMPLLLARRIVKLRFSDEDKTRMHQLAVKNQEGQLTPEETEELDNFITVGDLLTLLQSKARTRIKHG